MSAFSSTKKHEMVASPQNLVKKQLFLVWRQLVEAHLISMTNAEGKRGGS